MADINIVSQSNQLKYIGEGPLDAKVCVGEYSELFKFAASEKYVGMTVTVTNAETTQIPEDYWLIGGISNDKWVKKLPNYDLRLNSDGKLYIINTNTNVSGTAIDIKQFIQEQTHDQFVKSGSVVESNGTFFLKLEYQETRTPLMIDLSAIAGGLDPTKYYTKEQVDAKIAEVRALIPDVSKFVTSGYVKTQIDAKEGEIKAWVEGKGYLTEHQSLSAYSTTEQVQKMIEDAKLSGDTSRFVTSAQVETQINTKLENYYDKTAVENKIEDAVKDKVTSGQVETQINAKLNGYATEAWVEGQGYLKEHQSLSAYSTTEQVQKMIEDAKLSGDTSRFVTSAQVQTQIEQNLSGYATTNYVDEQIEEVKTLIPSTDDFAKKVDVEELSGATKALEKRVEELEVSGATIATDEKTIIKRDGVISVQLASAATIVEEIKKDNAIAATDNGIGIYIMGDDVEL